MEGLEQTFAGGIEDRDDQGASRCLPVFCAIAACLTSGLYQHWEAEMARVGGSQGCAWVGSTGGEEAAHLLRGPAWLAAALPG